MECLASTGCFELGLGLCEAGAAAMLLAIRHQGIRLGCPEQNVLRMCVTSARR